MPTFDYFSQQGRISDPGIHGALYEGLPTSMEDLVKVVQGVTIHVFWTERYGFKAPPERMAELQLRWMDKRLARTLELDERPLVEARPIDRKLLGNCRDHISCVPKTSNVPAGAVHVEDNAGYFGVVLGPDEFRRELL